MNRTKKIALNLEYEVEVCASVSPGHPGTFRVGHGGSPPEGPEVEDLYVGVIIKGTTIDITSLLNQKQLEHIEELCFENAQEQDEADRDASESQAFDRYKDERRKV